ncbi:MAG: glycosyltransferase family 4 protein [Nanoarchaeota archaeon]
MNILFVLENYYPHIGGVEVVFKNLAEGLVKLGNDVSIITHRLKDTKKFEVINDVKIYRISCFHSRYWFTFLSIPLTLKLAKEADIIHTTTYNGAFPAWLASKLTNTPSLITIHEILGKRWNEFDMNPISSKLHQFLEWLITRLNFDYFIAISQSTEKDFLKIKKTKNLAKIYNGIDYNLFNPKKYDKQKIRKKLNLRDKFIYMFYGRPGISKGLEYLIHAVPEISNKIPNSILLAIVSRDKAYLKRYNYIINLIKKLKVQDKILLLEPVPYKELPEYIMAADCIIVPSLTEGFGFTAAESCAMEKPVIASNTTSLPEVVSGKYILIEPKKPEGIVKGVIIISQDKIVSKGKKVFKWEDTIKGYLDIYNKLRR